ncbi:15-hydroxyprostaglandin dehydrogenase [NAD(+)]-like [Sitophilus oryzae]|uniref:15-hydroxyprostaglandin dehydrogenase [NAD(+)]-like n=1 Tax=Sitophilus oryzae TaxID=7048 RepID=A0A6J2XWN5_SITOR|nr:15-hydroxyprostaglandin dehydrogenase [NAD(+)]-like [Sitophilus oryzae]
MDIIAGKVALITGGATGIGAAYVKELFKRGMKAATISDIDDRGAALAEEINCCYGKGRAIFINADVTNCEAFKGLFDTNMKKFDRLDLVINNAGILRDKTWQRMLDINISATVRGSLLGIQYMGRNNGGCGGTIVNTASILGLQPLTGCPVYTGTKHFVIGFTRSIGTKYFYDLTGVRFLTICPGVTITPLITDAEDWAFDGFPNLGKTLAQQLGSLEPQSVEWLAEGLNTMLNEGENGSVWVGEEAKPIYEVAIPDRKTYKKERKC